MELNEYGEIVFKTTTSKMIHMAGYHNYTWQRSYYDHIIRNNDSLIRIRKYIINNPANWDKKNTDTSKGIRA